MKEVEHYEDKDSTKNNNDDKNEVKCHEQEITDLLPIPEMNLIASASTDGYMILWNLRDMQHKSTHSDHIKNPSYS